MGQCLREGLTPVPSLPSCYSILGLVGGSRAQGTTCSLLSWLSQSSLGSVSPNILSRGWVFLVDPASLPAMGNHELSEPRMIFCPFPEVEILFFCSLPLTLSEYSPVPLWSQNLPPFLLYKAFVPKGHGELDLGRALCPPGAVAFSSPILHQGKLSTAS